MFKHVSYHLEWAKQLKEEIDNDNSDWWHPNGPMAADPKGPGDFNYSRMRFVNENINYFHFKSIISMALRNNYEYNPNYPKVLEFCNAMRSVVNETGPFGRMCIWNMIPKGYLLPHVDDWNYHRQIRRYIFCISEHSAGEATIKINNTPIEVKQGLFFQFNPATELHEFINHTDKNWYFLSFDYWDIDKLQKVSIERNITKETEIEYNQRYPKFKS